MNYDTWVVLQNAIKGNSFLHCNWQLWAAFITPFPFPHIRVPTVGRRPVDAGIIVHGASKAIWRRREEFRPRVGV